MAFFLRKQRDEDVVGAYKRYQQYLRDNQEAFPQNAYALATAEWYYNPDDHRSPHDAWLESLIVLETEAPATKTRFLSMRTRLLGAHQDGHIEFSYAKVFAYSLGSESCNKGLCDWLYDEFRLSREGRVIQEIEWSCFPHGKDAHWIIEASDVEFRWIPQTDAPRPM